MPPQNRRALRVYIGMPPFKTFTPTRPTHLRTTWAGIYRPDVIVGSPKYYQPIPHRYRLRSSRAKTRPHTPGSLMWQCHVCNGVCRMGITRRCLNCGHVFCWSAPAGVKENWDAHGDGDAGGPRDPHPLTRSPNAENEKAEENDAGKGASEPTTLMIRSPQQAKRRRQGGKNKAKRSCVALFDYEGWERWNRWREEVCGKGEGCDEECMFPSECAMRRVEGAKWERNVKMELEVKGEDFTDIDVDIDVGPGEGREEDVGGQGERMNVDGDEEMVGDLLMPLPDIKSGRSRSGRK